MENRYDLSGSLLHWYDYNKRLLPWRENKDPYRIWISEIMLQQTRVEAVKPYFDRFMEALPTVYDLAEVEDDRLMKLWEGLGYYNRARNLKAAAQTIVQEYGGQLPADYDKLLSLKGIGMYTAGAIGSIAFELQVPAVDGNVLRQNGDAALTLEVVRVHDAVDDLLIFAVHAALLEHFVDEGGLAVVDVGDDGYIAKFFILHR